MSKSLFANATLYPNPIKLERIDFPPMVQVTCWDGQQKNLSKWVEKNFDLTLPAVGRSEHSETTRILSNGVNRWLIMGDEAADLESAFNSKVGTFLDLSSARSLFRLQGPEIARLLNKGCAIDFSAGASPAGAVIMTSIDHMGVLIHKIDEELYDLFVFGSYADAMAHWLQEAACDMRLIA